ncbi:MAG: glycosyltransferase [Thermoguttaceae bacterium]|nr:glycosyltransferase [Thermoguttaceae bacterium]
MTDSSFRTEPYSVLMSVYVREKPEHLRTALESIWNQTVKTDDFVLVCDGPLTAGLDAVIEQAEKEHPELSVVRLEKNLGLGKALNRGIKFCKNELVARMDSDDISRSDRCERQLEIFGKYPEISICSGTVEEFSQSTDLIESRRVVPEKQNDILVFARKRNPFNHPCVMYRKSAVQEAGGYQDFFLLEDYYLWIRMLQKGFTGYNIQHPLLWMRAGSEMYKRRAGWKYMLSQNALFKYMKTVGFVTRQQYVMSSVVRCIASLIPNEIRKKLFRNLLRK